MMPGSPVGRPIGGRRPNIGRATRLIRPPMRVQRPMMVAISAHRPTPVDIVRPTRTIGSRMRVRRTMMPGSSSGRPIASTGHANPSVQAALCDTGQQTSVSWFSRSSSSPSGRYRSRIGPAAPTARSATQVPRAP